MAIKAIVFDFGNVLARFSYEEYCYDYFNAQYEANPAAYCAHYAPLTHLGRPILQSDPVGLVAEYFLANILSERVRASSDAGTLTAVVEREILAKPDWAEDLRAADINYTRMLRGQLPGIHALIADLKAAHFGLYLLSNIATDSFARAKADRRFAFLDAFDGFALSGEMGALKPGPQAYIIPAQRFDLPAGSAIFFDDKPENVSAAITAVGWFAYLFTTTQAARIDLARHGVLGHAPVPAGSE